MIKADSVSGLFSKCEFRCVGVRVRVGVGTGVPVDSQGMLGAVSACHFPCV